MEKNSFKTSIGGQALIEGVMMRGPERSAMAVRLPDGNIDVEITPGSTKAKAWYRKAPFVRGMFNMVDSLLFGYKCLLKSAEKSGMGDDEPPSRLERWLSEKLGVSIHSVVSVVALVLGAVLAIALFAVLPTVLVGLFSGVLPSSTLKSLLEGLLKIGILVGYMAAISKMQDIRRVFEYHGAEHKTIACYEAGQALTVEHVRTQSRFHPRCGTSFLLIVLLISILLFSVVTWSHVLVRVLLKILLLPLVVGISYEIIKLAGRYDNVATRFVSAPGLWLQRLTTREPKDDQIEVAIASMVPVLPEKQGDDEW